MGRVSGWVWRVAAFAWFWTEVGQFLEERTSIGHDPLFWPLWTSSVIALLLVAHVIDIWEPRIVRYMSKRVILVCPVEHLDDGLSSSIHTESPRQNRSSEEWSTNKVTALSDRIDGS